MDASHVDKEVRLLIEELKRLGKPGADGKLTARRRRGHTAQPRAAAAVRRCRRGRAASAARARVQCKFGTLVRDERCGDIFEALNGTLRAAKRKKVITFEGEMLLQGAHDAVDIVLLKEDL